MARIKPIRISESDRKEYARLAKNTRAKINRTAKKYGIDISGDIEIPKISEFKTRAEYNEWKDSVRRFTNRDNWKYQFVKNKYGVVASKKEIREVERYTEMAQRRAEGIIKDAKYKPFISGGKQQGTLADRMAMMGRPNAGGIYVPPDFNFDSMQTGSQFKNRKENLKERSRSDFMDRRANTMRDNFANILELSFHSAASDLADEIRAIPGLDFFEMYLSIDEFDFNMFDSDGQNVDADEGTLSEIQSYVNRYKRGKLNMDLKGF